MSRREEMIELRLQHHSYEDIAKTFGISRQRVHQILTGYKPKMTEKNKLSKKEYGRKYIRKYREDKGKEWQQKKNRYYATLVKEFVLTHYGNGKLECVKCGFNDLRALSIDHINGKGHQHRQGKKAIGNSFYRQLAKENYPAGYQTLCMNCQWIKKAENREYGEGRKPDPDLTDEQILEFIKNHPEAT